MSAPQGAPGSVAADLLLLAVGHRSSWLTRGPVHLVVAAGSVADDLLAGTPLEAMGADRGALAVHLLGTARQRGDDVTAGLAAAGAVAPLRTKVLGLFPRDGLQVLQPWARERAAARLVDALRPGARPAPADAAMAALASVGGLARVHVPVPRSERSVLQAQVNTFALHTGPAVAEVVMALRHALRRAGDSGDGAVLFVPGSDRDGYGDSGGQGDSSSGGDGSGGWGGGDGGGDGGGGGGGGGD